MNSPSIYENAEALHPLWGRCYFLEEPQRWESLDLRAADFDKTDLPDWISVDSLYVEGRSSLKQMEIV